MSKFILVFILLLVPILIWGQTFNTQTVTPGSINSNSSISYGPTGAPYILFVNSNSLHLTYWNGTSWTTRNIGGFWHRANILRADTCFYYVADNGSNHLYFYRLSFTGISTQLGNFYGVHDWAISIGANNNINIVYRWNGLYYRNFNVLTQGFSTPELVDGLITTGYWPSVATSGDGRIWISYKENTNADLRMARRKVAGGWDSWYVETTGDVGNYSQIAIDASNVAHITYYDATNRRLKYATFNP